MKNYFIAFIFLVTIGCSDSSQAGSPATPKTVAPVKSAPTKQIEVDKRREFDSLIIQKIIHNNAFDAKNRLAVHEPLISSPKSVVFTPDGKKLYVQSLEGFQTIVFDAKTLQKISVIDYKFDDKNQHLFKDNENSVFDYQYAKPHAKPNHFWGKPVEATFSHNGRYLWVSFYRRSFDDNASSPSAVAIIDTTTDKIVRVMPTGPLPKMLATSPDNHYVAVTHWGDNTVGLIDIASDNPMNFRYVWHSVIDYKLAMNFGADVNRDSQCGNCLRGTVFTPDSKKLLVGKMGGNGIAVLDIPNRQYLGTITGSMLNVRHLVINHGKLIISTNKNGTVQSASLDDIFNKPFKDGILNYTNWRSVFVGSGVRTIDVSDDGRYIFSAVNDVANVSVIDASTMKVVGVLDVSKFPVGMALSPDQNTLVVTSQGKSGVVGAGNAVTVIDVKYKQ